MGTKNKPLTNREVINAGLSFVLIVVLGVAIALTTSSCSHNGLVVIDGKYFGATASGFHYANGFVLIGESRENSHLRVELADSDSVASGASGNLRDVVAIEQSISHQATGNLKELAEVAPDAVMGYLQSDPGPAPFSGGNVPEISVDSVKPSIAPSTNKPAAESSKETTGNGNNGKAEEIIKEIGEKIEDYVNGGDVSHHTEQECENGECDINADDNDSGSGNAEFSSSSIPTQDIWKGSPEEQKSKAYYSGQYLLIMYARSTCSNCKKVFENLQTDSFTKFCQDNNIIPTKCYSDAKGNDYKFQYDYTTEGSDTLNLPSFILCKPLKPTGNTYAPGVDVESLGCLPASLTDTESKLESEILKKLKGVR